MKNPRIERSGNTNDSGEARISELDTVILVKCRPNEGLVKDNVGGVVMVHEGGKAFEAEFTTLVGDTLVVLPQTADEVRPISVRAVSHVRVA